MAKIAFLSGTAEPWEDTPAARLDASPEESGTPDVDTDVPVEGPAEIDKSDEADKEVDSAFGRRFPPSSGGRSPSTNVSAVDKLLRKWTLLELYR